jgi:hypothetical protein
MRKKRQNAPESGTQIFHNGCRVYIPSIQAVGTVLGFESSKYLVRFMNHHGILETKFFKAESLIEQPVLPFESIPF